MEYKYPMAAWLLLGGLAYTPAYAQDAARAAQKFLAEDGTPTLVQFRAEAPAYALTDAKKAFTEQLQLGTDDLMLRQRSDADALGFVHEKFQQYYKGIRIEHASYTLHARQGKVLTMSGQVEHINGLNPTPALAADAALQRALAFVGAKKYMWEDPAEEAGLRQQENNARATYRPQGELVIVRNQLTTDPARHDQPVLAWKFNVYAQAPLSRAFVYVDAHTGEVVLQDAIIKHAAATGTFATKYSGTQTGATDSFNGAYRLREATRGSGIETYNAKKGSSYTAAVDFTDADNSWTEYNNANFDDVALDAHWGAQGVYDYWKNVHNRNSYDGNGAKIKSYVHFDDTPGDGKGYENAFWNGSVMTYGDGASTFKPLTALDVCAHEIGHAVCSSTANLVYSYESGALNEGFSDIWGAVIENYKAPNKQPWLIGEDIIKSTTYTCLRSMSDPGGASVLSKGPAYYKGTRWATGSADNGGVHTNSSVLNHWFYILSVGKSGTNEGGNAYNVTGISISKAANIAYRTEANYLSSNSNYANARTYSIQAATDLYGAGSAEVIATTNAWYAVGVGAAYSGGGGGGTPQPATYCASKGNSQADEWVDLVSLGSINRTSGNDAGYYDGSALNTNVTAGSSQTISYSAAFSGQAYTENWKIYLDYNQDGDFTDSGELVASRSSSSAATLSSTFTVPTSAKNGKTRLRVVMSYSSSATSCGTYSYGETEDFSVTIAGGAAIADGGTGVSNGITLDDAGATPQLALYPNPATDVVRIAMPDQNPVASVQVTDLRGAKVSGVRVEGDQLNVSALAKGIYTLTVSDGQKVFHQRLVKQ